MCGAENIGKTSLGTTPGLSFDPVINLDQADPTMFESYWKRVGSHGRLVVSSCELMSYFSRAGHHCWFMEPEFEESVQRLHGVVGNAVTEGRYLLVGTGSSQLYLAALYALCSPNQSHPVSILCRTLLLQHEPVEGTVIDGVTSVMLLV